MLRLTLIVLSLLVLCAVPSFAQSGLPLTELGAGPAIVVPFDSDKSSFGAMDITAKILPIPQPDAITLKTIPQYVGANLGLDILITGVATDQVDGGASLPLYNSTLAKLPLRGGVGYVKGSGGVWFLKYEIVGTGEKMAPKVAGLVAVEPPPVSVAVAVGPSAVMVVGSIVLH
jgi:hypothetical protein